jgi:hypothetical protein
MTIERRTSPRYTFIAEVEVTVIATNTTLKARTTDISIDGCFLDMLNPSPKGTDIRVRISYDSNTFEAFGVVADSGRCRSAFRDDADHYSVLIPIRIPL